MFVALSDFADIFVKLRYPLGDILNQSHRRSFSVRVPVVWKRQLIDGHTFSSRSEKWLELPKSCMQHEATTALKLNV